MEGTLASFEDTDLFQPNQINIAVVDTSWPQTGATNRESLYTVCLLQKSEYYFHISKPAFST